MRQNSDSLYFVGQPGYNINTNSFEISASFEGKAITCVFPCEDLSDEYAPHKSGKALAPEVESHLSTLQAMAEALCQAQGVPASARLIVRLPGAFAQEASKMNMPEQMPLPLKVFLCHCKADKDTVRNLYHRLVSDGISPWLDEIDLLPGQKWRDEIPKAVRSSHAILICLSSQAVNKEGYIQKEIVYALDVAQEKPEGTIFLIPIRLEECDVPERISAWQWVNYFDENGYDRIIKALKRRADQLNIILK